MVRSVLNSVWIKYSGYRACKLRRSKISARNRVIAKLFRIAIIYRSLRKDRVWNNLNSRNSS